MTTPRTMDSIRKAAERAGEIAYEHRRRAVDQAAKAAAEKTPPEQPADDSHADE